MRGAGPSRDIRRAAQSGACACAGGAYARAACAARRVRRRALSIHHAEDIRSRENAKVARHGERALTALSIYHEYSAERGEGMAKD